MYISTELTVRSLPARVGWEKLWLRMSMCINSLTCWPSWFITTNTHRNFAYCNYRNLSIMYMLTMLPEVATGTSFSEPQKRIFITAFDCFHLCICLWAMWFSLATTNNYLRAWTVPSFCLLIWIASIEFPTGGWEHTVVTLRWCMPYSNAQTISN